MTKTYVLDDSACLVFSTWQIEELERKAYDRGVKDTLEKLGLTEEDFHLCDSLEVLKAFRKKETNDYV